MGNIRGDLLTFLGCNIEKAHLFVENDELKVKEARLAGKTVRKMRHSLQKSNEMALVALKILDLAEHLPIDVGTAEIDKMKSQIKYLISTTKDSDTCRLFHAAIDHLETTTPEISAKLIELKEARIEKHKAADVMDRYFLAAINFNEFSNKLESILSDEHLRNASISQKIKKAQIRRSAVAAKIVSNPNPDDNESLHEQFNIITDVLAKLQKEASEKGITEQHELEAVNLIEYCYFLLSDSGEKTDVLSLDEMGDAFIDEHLENLKKAAHLSEFYNHEYENATAAVIKASIEVDRIKEEISILKERYLPTPPESADSSRPDSPNTSGDDSSPDDQSTS